MTKQISTTSLRLQAHIAGISYLMIIVVGGFGFVSGGALIVSGNAAATASNILASESLWRAGFAALLVMLTCDVIVAGWLEQTATSQLC